MDKRSIRFGVWAVALLLAPFIMAPIPVGEQMPVTVDTLVTGVVIPGSLTAMDEMLPDGEPAHRYQMIANAGDVLSIWVVSDDFDTMLYVNDPSGAQLTSDDNGLFGTNSVVHFAAPVAGLYQIVVSTYQAGATGNYRILAVSGPSYAPAASNFTDAAVAGSLETSDPVCLETGWQGDIYRLPTLTLGQMVTITVRSAAIDSKLFLVDSDGRVLAQDDNGAGARDATLTFPYTPAPGQTFYAVVSSAASGQFGGYYIERGTSGVSTPPLLPPPVTRTNLRLGEHADGSLDATDPAGHRAPPVDSYSFSTTVAQLIQIDATSEVFDTYVQLYNADGLLIGEDDDTGRDTNSRMLAEVLPGDYTIEVSSFAGGIYGAYRVTVDEGEYQTEPEDLTIGSTHELGWTVFHQPDEMAHRTAYYAFEPERDMPVTILLRPSEEAAFCRLDLRLDATRRTEDESSLQIDDGCVIVTDLRGTMRYLLNAQGERPGPEDNPFNLVIMPRDVAVRWESIDFNRDIDSEIRVSSPYTDWNAPGEGFTFEANSGDRLSITVDDTEIDARAVVLDLDGNTIASTMDSRDLERGGFTFTAPSSAWYRLIVTGRQHWFGTFTLRVSRR